MVMLVYQRVLGRAAGFHVLPPAEANENNQIVPKHPGTLINWWQAGGFKPWQVRPGAGHFRHGT